MNGVDRKKLYFNGIEKFKDKLKMFNAYKFKRAPNLQELDGREKLEVSGYVN